jgi:hypothetical protein
MRFDMVSNLGAYLAPTGPVHQHHRHRQLPVRRVRRARDLRAHPPGAHQHRADGRLPRRRPPDHVLRARAPDGPRRARARHGPGRVPPPQLHSRRQVSRTRSPPASSTTAATFAA